MTTRKLLMSASCPARNLGRGMTTKREKTGLLLGAYDGCSKGEVRLTETGEKFDESTAGTISKLLRGTSIGLKKAFVFGNVTPDYDEVALTGLGPEGAGYNDFENLNESLENIRVAAGVGARALQERGVTTIYVEGFNSPMASAEGAGLGTFVFDDFKDRGSKKEPVKLCLYGSADGELWKAGLVNAEAQNLTRKLVSSPGNLMSPSIFSQAATEYLCPCGVQVEAKSREWLKSHRFSALLEIAKGSCEAPILLELKYCGASANIKPIVFVGKGTTFDAGGLCLSSRDGRKLKERRANMTGAATIVGVFKAAAQLSLPYNIIGLIPLCENLLSGMAVKVGDVVVAMNNKTIRLDHTDNEGRVALADALSYSKTYKPCMVMTVGNLTEAFHVGIGEIVSGVFTNYEEIWNEFKRAGMDSGDRFWRFPIWKTFTSRVTGYQGVDVSNEGTDKGGDPCLGAAFLNEFAPCEADFAHIEISGSGRKVHTNIQPYVRRGTMSGRPVRGIVQFLYNLACPNTRVGPF